MSEEIKETAGGELTQGEFKVKKQVKKLTQKDTPIKIEFNKTEKAEKEITKVNLQKEDKTEKKIKEKQEDEHFLAQVIPLESLYLFYWAFDYPLEHLQMPDQFLLVSSVLQGP